MAGIKISELNSKTTLNNNDVLPIVDTDNNETKKINIENFKNEFALSSYKYVRGPGAYSAVTIPLDDIQQYDFIEFMSTNSAFSVKIPSYVYDYNGPYKSVYESPTATVNIYIQFPNIHCDGTNFTIGDAKYYIYKDNGSWKIGNSGYYSYNLGTGTFSTSYDSYLHEIRAVVGYKLNKEN